MAIATADIMSSANEARHFPSSCSLPTLRTGVILGSSYLPLWVRHILESLKGLNCLQLAAVLWIEGTPRTQWPEVPFTAGTALFKAWSWFDYQCYRRRTNRADALECDPVDVSGDRIQNWLLAGTGLGMAVRPADTAEVKAANLDVILDFGFCAVSPDMARLAKHGIWSLGTSHGWISALLRCMNRGSSVLETKISVQCYPDALHTLTCSHSALDLASVFRNCNTFYWKTAEALIHYLLRLHHYGWEFGNGETTKYSSAAEFPCNLETLGFVGRWFVRNLRGEIRKRLLRERWFIAYTPTIKNKIIHEGAKATVLEPPSDRFYADPFPFDYAGKTYVFFEDFRFEQSKGVISYFELDESGKCSEPEVVLEQRYHLSYPCLFEWQGHVYLLPETKNNNTVELYRAIDFPRCWQLQTALAKDVAALDPTILNYRGKFWLFTAGFAPAKYYSNGDDELFLFFSDSPLGPWLPHPKNPVVSDVRRSRPAGQLFVDQGRLIRPAQDSSALYGCAVCFNRVDVLSETDYRETPIATIAPDWFPKNLGTHTFNQSSCYQVVDGRVLVSRFRRSRPGLPKVSQRTIPHQLFWWANGK